MKVSIDQEIQLLKNVPLFSGLKSADLRIIALMTENCIFEAGEKIITEGEDGHEAYLVFSGKAEVFKRAVNGTSIPLTVLGPGEMFGELALFGDGVRTASVTAAEETLVAVISKENLYEIMREFPDIAIEMLKVQTRRFARSERKLIELLGKRGEA